MRGGLRTGISEYIKSADVVLVDPSALGVRLPFGRIPFFEAYKQFRRDGYDRRQLEWALEHGKKTAADFRHLIHNGQLFVGPKQLSEVWGLADTLQGILATEKDPGIREVLKLDLALVNAVYTAPEAKLHHNHYDVVNLVKRIAAASERTASAPWQSATRTTRAPSHADIDFAAAAITHGQSQRTIALANDKAIRYICRIAPAAVDLMKMPLIRPDWRVVRDVGYDGFALKQRGPDKRVVDRLPTVNPAYS